MTPGEAVDPIEIVRDVHRRLGAVGTAERREIAKGYFPTAMKVFGATVPDLRDVVRDLSKQLRKVGPRDVIRVAQTLVDGGFRR